MQQNRKLKNPEIVVSHPRFFRKPSIKVNNSSKIECTLLIILPTLRKAASANRFIRAQKKSNSTSDQKKSPENYWETKAWPNRKKLFEQAII
jgi:hypothetical protein